MRRYHRVCERPAGIHSGRSLRREEIPPAELLPPDLRNVLKVQETVTMTDTVTLPLSEAPIGKRVRIRRLSTGPDLSRRLRELGMGEHATVSCVLKGHGNI